LGLHLAIDLGAGSGRAVLGRLEADRPRLEELHRFHYPPRISAGHLRWPFADLLRGIRRGLRAAALRAGELGDSLATVGVDSWGVDYGLLDGAGRLIEEPVAYRDARTSGALAEVLEKVPRQRIFGTTGIQFMELNTLFQLYAQAHEGLPPDASRLLMIPDLCHHFLCGAEVCEYTNASTTQLLDARRREWDMELLLDLGLPGELMPRIVPPGTELGALRGELREELGIGPLRVLAPATHDTASAVAGTPLRPGWAYISSGTWSLLGVERGEPLIDDGVATANFTNEGGVFGTIRLLKNLMGLWVLESCRQEWQEAGSPVGYETLLRQVSEIDEVPPLVFTDHASLFCPESMSRAVAELLAATGQRMPASPAGLAKCILDSLALRYASVIDTVESLTGEAVPGIHIVGGGSLNHYLNQATADATGRPVLAGPAEATATGSLVLQAIASGELPSLAEARARVAAAVCPQRFEPSGSSAWSEARDRYRELEQRFVTGSPLP
jgi:rhamnulokinase